MTYGQGTGSGRGYGHQQGTWGGTPRNSGQPGDGGQPGYGGQGQQSGGEPFRGQAPGPFGPGYQGQPGYGPGPVGGPGMGMGPGLPPRPPRKKRHTGRNILLGLGGFVGLIIVIIVSIAANSGHSVQTTGSGTSNGSGSASGGSGSGGSAGGSTTAMVGSPITLSGNSTGEQMSVTVVKVITSGRPGDEFTSPPAGDRLYAVQFRLTDTGSAAYSDAPSNGATVVDSTGQSYQAAIADTISGCQAFPGTENVAPGSSGLGCIVFELPASATIKDVQFTLDSGLGPQTGQWVVG